MIRTKICGITDVAAADAAIKGGAFLIGLMFYPPSPRYLPLDRAAALADHVAGRVPLVGVFVDADDNYLGEVMATVPLDHLQLHGNEDESRVLAVRERFGKPVIKAVPVAGAEDIARAHAYEAVADMLLFDAKPPEGGGHLPGGNALTFDWRLIGRENWGKPWVLSGGLTAGNLADAVALSGAAAVDVSSGVERARGVKDASLIAAFLQSAARIGSPQNA
jgi:phosphoribosylanthranilate isomerase